MPLAPPVPATAPADVAAVEGGPTEEQAPETAAVGEPFKPIPLADSRAEADEFSAFQRHKREAVPVNVSLGQLRQLYDVVETPMTTCLAPPLFLAVCAC